MQIKCPECGNVCEVDTEPAIGQHIVCPFCSEKFAYSGEEEFCEAEDIEADDAQPEVLAGGLKVLGASTAKSHATAEGTRHMKFSPVDSRIIDRLTEVFHSSDADGWVRVLLFNMWWWFGNVFWSVLFVYGLIKLADLDDAMSMLGNARGVNGIWYIFLISVWIFALWSHWVIYKIAVGVYETISMLQNRHKHS